MLQIFDLNLKGTGLQTKDEEAWQSMPPFGLIQALYLMKLENAVQMKVPGLLN